MGVTQITNELGRTITVAAEVLESGDVQIEVIGPESTASNLLTRKEAEALYIVLGIALSPPDFTEEIESSFDNVEDLLAHLNAK